VFTNGVVRRYLGPGGKKEQETTENYKKRTFMSCGYGKEGVRRGIWLRNLTKKEQL
jgi:hypothetical protein